jgi:hypothetical protein
MKARTQAITNDQKARNQVRTDGWSVCRPELRLELTMGVSAGHNSGYNCSVCRPEHRLKIMIGVSVGQNSG